MLILKRKLISSRCCTLYSIKNLLNLILPKSLFSANGGPNFIRVNLDVLAATAKAVGAPSKSPLPKARKFSRISPPPHSVTGGLPKTRSQPGRTLPGQDRCGISIFAAIWNHLLNPHQSLANVRVHNAGLSPSHFTTQLPSWGNPGADRPAGAPSQPAAIIATA